MFPRLNALGEGLDFGPISQPDERRAEVQRLAEPDLDGGAF